VAAPAWSAEHPLTRWITAEPSALEFFQVLHLVERTVRERAALGQQEAVREALRLRPALSLGFPAADLQGAEWLDEGPDEGRLRLTTTFLGLYGSDSPLASHFTEGLLAEDEESQRVREFLDLFHHRLLSLLYRVWKKYRYHVTFTPEAKDQISQVILGFLGLGTAGLSERMDVPAVRLFRYAGLLAQRPRSACGLRGVLRDYFPDVPCEVEQCIGRWLPIEEGDRNRLGSRKCSLGQNFLLGERVHDHSGKFRVRLGPVGYEHYVRFLPPGDEAAQLRELVRFYCADPLAYDVEVILRGDEVPETPLSGTGMLGRLSWTTWLKSQPATDQAVVFGEVAAAR
jgi:type VI secretion system protein ImpH